MAEKDQKRSMYVKKGDIGELQEQEEEETYSRSDEPLRAGEIREQRDQERWELDLASAETEQHESEAGS